MPQIIGNGKVYKKKTITQLVEGFPKRGNHRKRKTCVKSQK